MMQFLFTAASNDGIGPGVGHCTYDVPDSGLPNNKDVQ